MNDIHKLNYKELEFLEKKIVHPEELNKIVIVSNPTGPTHEWIKRAFLKEREK